MKKIVLLFIALVILSTGKAQTTLDTALNFSVKDIHGYTHKLFPILDSNNYVVIDFFTPSCGPCTAYAPDFQQAYLHYGENQNGVYFLGISWGASNAMVQDFDSTYGLTYPSVSGSQGNGNSVVTDYNILSYPTVVVIAPDRSIKSQYVYPPDFQTLDSTLTAIMGIATGVPGIKEQSASGVYPNPATSGITVTQSLKKQASVEIRITSLLGETKLTTKPAVSQAGTFQQKINVENLLSGIYFVKILANGVTLSTYKFVKR